MFVKNPLGDSHMQRGMKSAVLEKHRALLHELHLIVGASWVHSHFFVLQGGRDFSNCELHPGCRLELPGEGLTIPVRVPFQRFSHNDKI